MALKRISCPSCGGNQFEHDSEGNLICGHCGTNLASPRETIVCTTCGTENPPDARRCMNCGLALGRICAVCNHPNPPGVDHCQNCANPLDRLSSVYMRTKEGIRHSTGVREQHLIETKREDMRYMLEQRARLDEEERRRLGQLAAQRTESQRQQRIMITVILIGFGVAIIIGAILLFMAANTPSP